MPSPGTEPFRPGCPHAPDPHQAEFDRQLEAMNPDLPITVAVRIPQAADAERVRADPAPCWAPTRWSRS